MTRFNGVMLRQGKVLNCLLFLSTMAAMAAPQFPSIIPQPVEVRRTGGCFTLNSSTVIAAEARLRLYADRLTQVLGPATGFMLKIVSVNPGPANTIEISLDDKLKPALGAEGYKVEVTPKGIGIQAATNAGILYGIETLRQMLPPAIYGRKLIKGQIWTIPCASITDYPRFPWRGILLDPARHFIPKKDLLKFIDAMVLHKLNRLQLHLTDDQGWRIEIKKYPKLTEIGGWRDETLVGHPRGKKPKFDGTRHGGFYSQAEMREIIQYAMKLNITIVPEIEMPGHFRCAIAAYPWLGVFPEKQKSLKPWTRWGVSTDILAPRPEGVEFCRNVLTEVIDLFPSKFIHVGGDEAKKDQWKSSPEVQKMIKEKGLKNEHELQSWFIKQIDSFLSSKGRRLVGWDEILEGGLAKGATVMSWRGTRGGIAAAQTQHDVVMAPTSHTYFDYYQARRGKGEPLAIGGFLPLERVYSYNPVPKELSPAQAKHVLGTQAQLWGEYISTQKHREYMAFPRACALAEVAWTPRKDQDPKRFTSHLREHLKRLKYAGINYRRLTDGQR